MADRQYQDEVLQVRIMAGRKAHGLHFADS